MITDISQGTQFASVVVLVAALIFQIIILIPLTAFTLWLSGKVLGEGFTFLRSLLPAAVGAVIGYALSVPGMLVENPVFTLGMSLASFLVGVTLHLVLPKIFFGLDWKRGLLTGLLWFAFNMAAGMLFAIIVIVIAVVIGISLGIAAM
ncbi:MAG: hypothetical protein R6U32_04220 [Candidatus Woesearchaeota archaeon]